MLVKTFWFNVPSRIDMSTLIAQLDRETNDFLKAHEVCYEVWETEDNFHRITDNYGVFTRRVALLLRPGYPAAN